MRSAPHDQSHGAPSEEPGSIETAHQVRAVRDGVKFIVIKEKRMGGFFAARHAFLLFE